MCVLPLEYARARCTTLVARVFLTARALFLYNHFFWKEDVIVIPVVYSIQYTYVIGTAKLTSYLAQFTGGIDGPTGQVLGGVRVKL